MSQIFQANPNMQQMPLESKQDRVKKFLKTVYFGELIANHILLANILEIATALGVEGLTHEKCPPYEQCPKYMQVIMYSHYGRNPNMSKPGTKSVPSTNRIQPAPAKARNKPPGEFLCGICGEDFEREIACQMHDMLAHGSKFSQCLICIKLLNDDADLDTHYRQEHSMDPRCQLSKGVTCDVCSYMFPRRLMKAHVWFIHQVHVYPCNLCNKSFTAEEQARTHSSLIHGRLLKLI
ncbi:hypothetical protein B566_EDAN012578 [Ephemera danica]|nr:hypothetical protein B566_EDAN012578 [Ephemera danica]